MFLLGRCEKYGAHEQISAVNCVSCMLSELDNCDMGEV